MSAPRVVGHRAQRRVTPAELAFQLVVQGFASRGTAVARPASRTVTTSSRTSTRSMRPPCEPTNRPTGPSRTCAGHDLVPLFRDKRETESARPPTVVRCRSIGGVAIRLVRWRPERRHLTTRDRSPSRGENSVRARPLAARPVRQPPRAQPGNPPRAQRNGPPHAPPDSRRTRRHDPGSRPAASRALRRSPGRNGTRPNRSAVVTSTPVAIASHGTPTA